VLREALADYGSVYLIVLGAVAVLVMVKFPRGLWGYVQQRFDLRFFPVQRRVRLDAPAPNASSVAVASGTRN
jgi:branched-chain amino acid transport system permease protein